MPDSEPDDGPTSWRNSVSTSGCDATPTDPDIWGALAILALRVAHFNPAESGCERLAPVSSLAVELRLATQTGTISPEPLVTRGEGPGTPGLMSPGFTSARTRDLNFMVRC